MNTIIRIAFSIYFAFLFYIFFLARRRPSPTFFLHREPVNFIPLIKKIEYITSTEKLTFHDRWNFYTDLTGNILIFVPFAFFFLIFSRMRNMYGILFTALLTSIIVETMQFILSIGVADIDDVILNTTGAFVGFLLFKTYLKKYPANSFQ